MDDDVAWTGTSNGAWDEYTQAQYPRFSGYNAISEATLEDADPSNDLTPAGVQRLTPLAFAQRVVGGAVSHWAGLPVRQREF